MSEAIQVLSARVMNVNFAGWSMTPLYLSNNPGAIDTGEWRNPGVIDTWWWILTLLVGLVIPLYLSKIPGAIDSGEWRNSGVICMGDEC